jgi:phosphoglycerate dehydrogenase-like enzyme
MSHVVWSQWEELLVPAGFTKLSPSSTPLDSSDLSSITFYVPQYMGGRKALLHVPNMSNLQYLQLPNAGYEDALEFIRPGLTICNARGVHDASTAELAVGLAIAARRGFAQFSADQINGEWNHKRYPSLNDSKIGIIGAGSIARTIGRYLAPYDVEITYFSRTAKAGAKAIADIDAHLPDLDLVILALPLNTESQDLFDAKRLARMKDGAAIVNVARGPIINTEALIAELNTGRLFAGLDVTNPEPLPAGHPLWSAKNCVITPHVGGDSTAFESRGRRLVEEQLARLASGNEIINIVAVE